MEMEAEEERESGRKKKEMRWRVNKWDKVMDKNELGDFVGSFRDVSLSSAAGVLSSNERRRV